jgi:serine phosphatase RsbU (regulator of sigma subunit)
VLRAAENAPPSDAVEAVTGELAEILGATDVSFLITDMSGRGLVRLGHGAAPGAGHHPDADRPDADSVDPHDPHDPLDPVEELPHDGGAGERVLRTQSVEVVAPGTRGVDGTRDGSWHVLAPVTERGEALGLLELVLPLEPDADVVEDIARTAHALAFVIIANRRHTDLFERAQRSTQYTLAAEIQRRLLPGSLTCEAGAFSLSGWLEPADDVGGDTFDYSLGRDVLHLSMTDAMGHGVQSALTATLAVGSLRNSRRSGCSLPVQTSIANAALRAYAASIESEGYVTGVFARIDLPSGVISFVNAGHVLPYLVRGDEVSQIELPAGLPLGLFEDVRFETTELTLEPGDRLLMLTDGMLERKAAGLDMREEILATRSFHPREATRLLADRVLEVTGHQLDDDATLMILDWHGGHGDERDTDAGADVAAH